MATYFLRVMKLRNVTQGQCKGIQGNKSTHSWDARLASPEPVKWLEKLQQMQTSPSWGFICCVNFTPVTAYSVCAKPRSWNQPTDSSHLNQRFKTQDWHYLHGHCSSTVPLNCCPSAYWAPSSSQGPNRDLRSLACSSQKNNQLSIL